MRGRWAAKSTDLRLCETDLVIRRLHSSKSLSGNSYVAITSASKKIALVTSVALMTNGTGVAVRPRPYK